MRTCRWLRAGLLYEAIATRGRIDLSSYHRLYPSQEVLPAGTEARGTLHYRHAMTHDLEDSNARACGVILAGGLGTRLSASILRPKPLLEVSGRALVLHTLDRHFEAGLVDVKICLGHRAPEIIAFFEAKFPVTHARADRVSVAMRATDGRLCNVDLVDTGVSTPTGSRLRPIIGELPTRFLLSYVDTLCDLPAGDLLTQHRADGAAVTLAVAPFRASEGIAWCDTASTRVERFAEKPEIPTLSTSIGWFAVNRDAISDLVHQQESIWERHVLERLSSAGSLSAYRHTGWWVNVNSAGDIREAEARVAAATPH